MVFCVKVASAKGYETATMWLSDGGLVHKVSRVNMGDIPLQAYEDLRDFKLFGVNVGLLRYGGIMLAYFAGWQQSIY